MKKSVIFLIILAAVVVLVSPGIVGRLAERTMDENIDRAAAGSSDFIVSSRGFERGWFSSAGSHRVEIREGDLRDLLVAIVEPADPAGMPALIIDTQIDHGLIPLSSMTRERGTLVPGLGSAVSTLRVEFPDGESVAIPGKVYSHVGVTGILESSYLLEPGAYEADGGTLAWGQSEILVTSNPASGSLGLSGRLATLSAVSPDGELGIGATTFDIRQAPTRFGIPAGSIEAEVGFVELSAGAPGRRIGPLSLNSTSRVDGDKISGALRVELAELPTGLFGPGKLVAELALSGADGAALGRLNRTLRDVVAPQDPELVNRILQADLGRLLAAGLALDIPQLDLETEAGTMALEGRTRVAATDSTAVSWPAVLLATDAELKLSVPAPMVEVLTSLRPEAQTLVALGYLRRRGDDFIVEAGLEDGTIMINGAPMQIPLDAFR